MICLEVRSGDIRSYLLLLVPFCKATLFPFLAHPVLLLLLLSPHRAELRCSIEWFIGGETNVCYNALDRQIEMGHGSRTAFHWVGNDEGETKDYTFSDMFNMVS